MKRALLFHSLLYISLITQGASSSKQNKKKRGNNVIIDIDKIQNTPDNQLVGTKAFAGAFTQAVYGKECEEKFCTPLIRKRLKHLKENNPTAFGRLVQQLGQANQAITHRSNNSHTQNTRFNSQMLTEIISPEMIQQLIKAWKESHQQQEQQIGEHAITINDHQATIETHEGTIATQNQNLRATRYKFYASIGTTILGIIGTVVTAWVASSSC